jgi:hypothetical protein
MHQIVTNNGILVLNYKENGLLSLFHPFVSASDGVKESQTSEDIPSKEYLPKKLRLEATSKKWDLVWIVSICCVLWIEIISVIGILFLILLVSGTLRHFFQSFCVLFAPIECVEIAARILETCSFCYGTLKLMSHFFQIEIKTIINR